MQTESKSMEKQTEFTFTMGSDRLLPAQWRRLQKAIADMVSRDFGHATLAVAVSSLAAVHGAKVQINRMVVPIMGHCTTTTP
jgi:hypothetical protein